MSELVRRKKYDIRDLDPRIQELFDAVGLKVDIRKLKQGTSGYHFWPAEGWDKIILSSEELLLDPNYIALHEYGHALRFITPIFHNLPHPQEEIIAQQTAFYLASMLDIKLDLPDILDHHRYHFKVAAHAGVDFDFLIYQAKKRAKLAQSAYMVYTTYQTPVPHQWPTTERVKGTEIMEDETLWQIVKRIVRIALFRD